MSSRWSASVLVSALWLGACAGVPQQYYYTLRSDAAAAPKPADGKSAGVIVGPVTIPDLLDRPQWVVRDGPNQLRVLEQQLWAQPLQADVAQAVAAALNRQLGDVVAHADVSGLPSLWPVAPRLRVQIDVLRFESRVAPAVAISDEYRWAVSCFAGKPASASRTGIATIEAPVPLEDPKTAPYPALAEAHARGLQQAGQDIGAALTAIAASCPSS